MNKKYLFKIKIIFLIIIVLLCQSSKADTKYVTAKELIDIAGNAAWEKNYNSKEASYTREYVDKTAGPTIMKKIDENYENIKITKGDIENLSKKTNLLLFAALYAKWSEMTEEDKNKYNTEEHFNFETITEVIGDKQLDDDVQEVLRGKTYIYKWPKIEGKQQDSTENDSIDQIITDADTFLSYGSENQIDTNKMKSTFSDILNVFSQIGVGLTVIIGLVLGVKFMVSGITEKADVKKMLSVYAIACVIIYGAFGIWKTLIDMLVTI